MDLIFSIAVLFWWETFQPSHVQFLVWSLIILLAVAYQKACIEYAKIDKEANWQKQKQPDCSINDRRQVPNPHDQEPGAEKAFGNHQDGLLCPVFMGSTPRRPDVENVKDESHSTASPVVNDEDIKLYGRPMLFPCKLTHRRRYPFKHIFSNSFLVVGVPVGLRAAYSPLLCVDSPVSNSEKWWHISAAWFHVEGKFHGVRGSHGCLRRKLHDFLISEKADVDEFAYAYIVTVPAINGHQNNPVGFWYLYSSAKQLTAVIVELNTSFGERRLWLVRRPQEESYDHNSKTFKGHFAKDVFVSPFTPLGAGSYTIEVTDPLHPGSAGVSELVILRGGDGSQELLSRISSNAPPFDVSTASLWARWNFLLRWWWIPLPSFIYGRILVETIRIKVRFDPKAWPRPELGPQTLGKSAGAVEAKLERFFRFLLKDAVEKCPDPIALIYITPGEHSKRSECFKSRGTTSASTQQITLHVLTPIFYTRFFHYSSPTLALKAELFDPEHRCRTAVSSDVEHLITVFRIVEESPRPTPPQITLATSLSWGCIAAFRAAPPALGFPAQTEFTSFTGASWMDGFVRSSCPPDQVKEYRQSLLRVFIGERIAADLEVFGMSRDGVLSIYDAGLSVLLLWIAGMALDHLMQMKMQMKMQNGREVAELTWSIALLCLPASWYLMKRFA